MEHIILWGIGLFHSLDRERPEDRDAFRRPLQKLYRCGIWPGLYNFGKIRLTASNLRISDALYDSTLVESVASFLTEDRKNVSYMNLYIEYTCDSRNNRAYPLNGNYLKGFVDKRGIGILSHDADYFLKGIYGFLSAGF